MDKDPYKSDWENKIEAAREQENRELSIEFNYPPPGGGEKMDKTGVYMPVAQQVAIIKAYGLFDRWPTSLWPGREEVAIEAKAALEEAFPWLLDNSEDYMEENY